MNGYADRTGRQARPGSRKILVVSNGIVEGRTFRTAVGLQIGEEQRADIRVIAPALNSRVRHWLSDDDEARRSAALRLAAGLESLSAAGIEADGQVGDADPIQAIADALYRFAADEIVILTDPKWRSHWQTHDLVGRAQRRFARAVVHGFNEPGLGARETSASGTRLGRFPKNPEACAAATLNATAHRIGPLDRRRIAANG
jgi:hypothetical protein